MEIKKNTVSFVSLSTLLTKDEKEFIDSIVDFYFTVCESNDLTLIKVGNFRKPIKESLDRLDRWARNRLEIPEEIDFKMRTLKDLLDNIVILDAEDFINIG